MQELPALLVVERARQFALGDLDEVVQLEGPNAHDALAVATAAARKGHGLGTDAVLHSLGSLARDGVSDVGAVITDGNVASERLFRRLEFARVGPWG